MSLHSRDRGALHDLPLCETIKSIVVSYGVWGLCMLTNNFNQKGNVLFLILIAVALFAALSYAVTRSTSGGGNANSEKLNLDVSQVLQYGATIKTAILRMRLNGVADTQLSFVNSSGVENYTNANCTTTSCQIFHLDGGGVTWQEAPTSIIDTAQAAMWQRVVFVGSDPYYGHGTDGSNASNADLVMTMSANESACIAYNKAVGFDAFVPDVGPDDAVNNSPAFIGTYSAAGGYAMDHVDVVGRQTFCIQHPANHAYRIYYVLLAR